LALLEVLLELGKLNWAGLASKSKFLIKQEGLQQGI